MRAVGLTPRFFALRRWKVVTTFRDIQDIVQERPAGQTLANTCSECRMIRCVRFKQIAFFTDLRMSYKDPTTRSSQVTIHQLPCSLVEAAFFQLPWCEVLIFRHAQSLTAGVRL